MKKRTRIRRLFLFLALALVPVILTCGYLMLPQYMRKVIRYGTADLDDYTIFKNRIVAKGSSCSWNFSKSYNKITISENFLDSLKFYKTTSFLVIKNDSILFEYYSDDKYETEITNSFSMAKSIVGILIGCAIDDGYISLNQTIDHYLPELTNLKQITIENLLTMSSGTDWDESYNTFTSTTTKAYYGNDIDAVMHSLKVIETPGTIFRYKSGDTQLLAMILNRVTGKSLSEYASQKIWKPLRAEHDALWSLDKKDGMEKGFCCFNSNARDFAKIGALMLNLGFCHEQQLVPQSYMISCISPAKHLRDKKNEIVTYYGYQWWILNHRNEFIPYARGILGQYIFVIPSQRAVIVRLGHKANSERTSPHPNDVTTWVNLGMEIIDDYNSKK